ncbi:peptidase inhibitor family I36 protein [Dactylosporangium sp. NPDC051485]|uniref:peptidase inhibitor family I36 protein n=1 Tax=Dactylosporangium sp. NPDC051485 TaxID=3154846 RepID=UPI0034121652
MNQHSAKKRPLVAALLSTGLAVAGLVAASPASAAPATSRSVVVPFCPDEYICFYPFKNFGGGQGRAKDSNPDFSKLAHTKSECHTGTWNDCIESVSSSAVRCTAYLYVNANYKGHYHTLSPGDAVWDFGIVYHDEAFNDQISSNAWAC